MICFRIQRADFIFLAGKLGTLLKDPETIYYIPAEGGCPARGILLHEYYFERTDLSKNGIIVRRNKIRRLPIDSELTAEGNQQYYKPI